MDEREREREFVGEGKDLNDLIDGTDEDKDPACIFQTTHDSVTWWSLGSTG
jgi:hypothetical protein